MWYNVKTYLQGGIAVKANSEEEAKQKFIQMIKDGELSEDDLEATLAEEE